MIVAIANEIRLKHLTGSILLSLLSVVAVARFLFIGVRSEGVELVGFMDYANDMTNLLVIPLTYMYLCEQCGTKWYRTPAIVMLLLILLNFLPSLSFEIGDSAEIHHYDAICPRSINVFDDGYNVFHLSFKALVCVLQCIIMGWRMRVLYDRIKVYGLKFSTRLKNYFIWMFIFLIICIVTFANNEYVDSTNGAHWALFATFGVVLTWGYILVPSSFSVSPIVTADGDIPVRLDVFFEKNVHLVERLHRIFEDDKIFLRQGIVIDDAAQLVGTNRTYFTRLMRREFGQTFSDYVSNSRIEYSKHLLAKGTISLEDVAQRCGFPSASSFCRVFKRITGMTPTQWKNGE